MAPIFILALNVTTIFSNHDDAAEFSCQNSHVRSSMRIASQLAHNKQTFVSAVIEIPSEPNVRLFKDVLSLACTDCEITLRLNNIGNAAPPERISLDLSGASELRSLRIDVAGLNNIQLALSGIHNVEILSLNGSRTDFSPVLNSLPPSLRELELEFDELPLGELVRRLQDFRLRSLSLTQHSPATTENSQATGLTRTDIELLSQHSDLERLHLAGCVKNSSMLKPVFAIPSLKSVSLKNVAIDELFRGHYRKLELTRCEVSPSGISALGTMCNTLDTICLQHCTLSAFLNEDVQSLQEFNGELEPTTPDVGEQESMILNSVGDRCEIKLSCLEFPPLTALSKVVFLRVDCGRISTRSAEALRSLPRLRTLMIRSDFQSLDDVLLLFRSSSLVDLTLEGCVSVDRVSGLGSRSDNDASGNRLRSVRIIGMDDAVPSIIEELSRLSIDSLAIEACMFPKAMLADVLRIRNLKKLSLAWNESLFSGIEVVDVRAAARLQWLSLERTGIGLGSDCKILAGADLNTIVLDGNVGIKEVLSESSNEMAVSVLGTSVGVKLNVGVICEGERVSGAWANRESSRFRWNQ